MDNNYYGNICYCRRCDGIIHTIKRGDSLYLLSRHYNVPIGEIMSANRNLNVYNLQIGQEICIPMRRTDMMNDGMMNNDMTNNNMMNRDMTTDIMMNRDMIDDNSTADTPDNITVSDVDSNDFSTSSFDTSTKMSELLQREDMTFEAFRDLMAEYLK